MARELTGALGRQSNSDVYSTATTPKRIVDRLDPHVVNVLTVVGFAAPVLVYLLVLHHYSVNVVVGDQWDDVTVIARSYTHFPDWSSLWAQHNENRIFFPNLIVLLLAYTTHFNIQVEEALSAVMLCVAVALLICAHKRRSPSTPWLYYVPVVLLAFSIVQYSNMVWGFQMAWFMVLLSLVTAMVLLDRLTLTWLVFVGALAAAVIGSFSSLQGLLIWPAGGVLLYHRHRRPVFVVTWIASAIASVFVYFHNFDVNSATPNHNLIWQHPIASIKFYLVALGDIVGVFSPGPNPYGIFLFGLVILVLGVGTLAAYGVRRDESGGSPLGIALICFGLLFAVTVTDGRLFLGLNAASASRYTTFDLLIPIGVYLALLGRPTLFAEGTNGHPAMQSRLRRMRRKMRWTNRKTLPVARGLLAVVLILQISLGSHFAFQGIRYNYAYDTEAVKVLRNIDNEPNNGVEFHLYLFMSASFIRKQAAVLKQHHLSLFSGN